MLRRVKNPISSSTVVAVTFVNMAWYYHIFHHTFCIQSSAQIPKRKIQGIYSIYEGGKGFFLFKKTTHEDRRRRIKQVKHSVAEESWESTWTFITSHFHVFPFFPLPGCSSLTGTKEGEFLNWQHHHYRRRALKFPTHSSPSVSIHHGWRRNNLFLPS